VIDAKAPRERTFLMGEIVELLDSWSGADGTAAGARSAVSRANECRTTSSRDLARLVIADPLGKPPAVMYETAHKIDQLVRQLIRGLFGPLEEVDIRVPESRVQ
jgi:hypothetical protein